MTRVGPAPSHSALSRACANSLSKQQGPSPAPGATDVTGGGTPVPLPRQRPGSAAAHVSRVPGCPRSSCHRAGAARAVHGRVRLPHAGPELSPRRHRVSPGTFQAPPCTGVTTVPCPAAAVPTLPSLSPHTCPCPRAHCGFRRWSPSRWPCPNPPWANTAPGHLPVTGVLCPAPLTPTQPIPEVPPLLVVTRVPGAVPPTAGLAAVVQRGVFPVLATARLDLAWGTL